MASLGVTTDCNSNGIEDASDISAATSLDCNSNGVPDECLLADCGVLDLVVIIDTSGSMGDEADALCCLIEDVVTNLASNGLTVNYEILNFKRIPEPLGITSCGAPCYDDTVQDRYGDTTEGYPSYYKVGLCSERPELSGQGELEDWGPAVAVVANEKVDHPEFPWTDGAVRVIVPISDEGPSCGSPVYDPGVDRLVIEHAIPIVRDNGIVVTPILGTLAGGNWLAQIDVLLAPPSLYSDNFGETHSLRLSRSSGTEHVAAVRRGGSEACSARSETRRSCGQDDRTHGVGVHGFGRHCGSSPGFADAVNTGNPVSFLRAMGFALYLIVQRDVACAVATRVTCLADSPERVGQNVCRGSPAHNALRATSAAIWPGRF